MWQNLNNDLGGVFLFPYSLSSIFTVFSPSVFPDSHLISPLYKTETNQSTRVPAADTPVVLRSTRPFLVIPYVRRITSNSSCLLLANNKEYLTLLVTKRVCVRKVSPRGRYCTWWDEIVAGLNPFLHHHHQHHHHQNNCLIINVIPIKVISLGPFTARPSMAPTFEDLVNFEIRQVHTAILPGPWWYWFPTSTHLSSPVNIFDMNSGSLSSLSLTSQQVLMLSSSFNRHGTNLAEIRRIFRLSSKHSDLTQMKFPPFWQI